MGRGVQLSLGTRVGEHSRGLVISAGRAQAGEAAAVGFTSQAQARAGQLPAASSTAAAEPRTPHNLLGGGTKRGATPSLRDSQSRQEPQNKFQHDF